MPKAAAASPPELSALFTEDEPEDVPDLVYIPVLESDFKYKATLEALWRYRTMDGMSGQASIPAVLIQPFLLSWSADSDLLEETNNFGIVMDSFLRVINEWLTNRPKR